MKRDEYIRLLKEKLLANVKEMGYEKWTQRELRLEINRAEEIGQLFQVMQDMAFDVCGAVALAMRLLIEDAKMHEFVDCPIRNWDT